MLRRNLLSLLLKLLRSQRLTHLLSPQRLPHRERPVFWPPSKAVGLEGLPLSRKPLLRAELAAFSTPFVGVEAEQNLQPPLSQRLRRKNQSTRRRPQG